MESIKALKQLLKEKNVKIIQNERGYIGEAIFNWNESITGKEIMEFEENNSIELPIEFKKFLQKMNGCTLFKEPKYCQWGCRILPLNQILLETQEALGEGIQLKSGASSFCYIFWG